MLCIKTILAFAALACVLAKPKKAAAVPSLDHPDGVAIDRDSAETEKLLTPQIALGGDSGAMFSFGSQEYTDERFQEALKQSKEEKAKVEDMKEQVGEETYEMIQNELLSRGKKAMDEPKKPVTRDGGAEADLTQIKPFAIDKTTVSVDSFRRFIKETKYKTEAEQFQWSFVHEYLLSKENLAIADDKEKGIGRVKESPWWVAVLGAYWKRPEGPGSTIKGRGSEPAVHISWNDAVAYCKWAGRRLPSEAEWEFAARGGLEEMPFPWGDNAAGGEVNQWQGEFPKHNTKQDGYAGLAPVDAFEPNRYGIYNMVGNVWEWVSGGTKEKRILRGGSYVDSVDGRTNHALRVSTRMENSADSGSHNTGFRCARSLKPKRAKKDKDSSKNEL